MATNQQIVLPVTGMTCANCVATIERNLKKIDGVDLANVNLSSERATIDFNPDLTGLDDFIQKINRAGYGVALGEADLLVGRLTDSSDVARLEKRLGDFPGVVEARANLATEKVWVKYVPTMVSQADIRKAIRESGFTAFLDFNGARPGIVSWDAGACSLGKLAYACSGDPGPILRWMAVLRWGL
jgi:Cu+-exporting ATPase